VSRRRRLVIGGGVLSVSPILDSQARPKRSRALSRRPDYVSCDA